MKRSLTQIMSRGDVVALDLGSSQAKCLRLSSSKPEVANISFAAVIPTQDMTEEWIAEHGLTGLPVVAPFSGESMVIQEVTLPPMPSSDIADSIRWHLTDIAEENIKNYVLRYSLVDTSPAQQSEQLRVIAYAAKRDEIAQSVERLQRLQLRPILIEPAMVSLAGTWDFLAERRHEGALLFLDLGQSGTRLVVAYKRTLLDARHLDPVPQSSSGEGTQPYYRWAVEVQNAIDAYTVRFKDRPIEQIYLGGGGATDPALPEYLSQNLGIPAAQLAFSDRVALPTSLNSTPAFLYAEALGVGRSPQLEDAS